MYQFKEDGSRYTAGLYIRLSKEDDKSQESESVTNQRSILENFTRLNGIEVFDAYIDDAVIIAPNKRYQFYSCK